MKTNNYLLLTMLGGLLMSPCTAKEFFIMKFDPSGFMLASERSTSEGSAGLSFNNVSKESMIVTVSHFHGFYLSGMKETYTGNPVVSNSFNSSLEWTGITSKNESHPQSILVNQKGEKYMITHFLGTLTLQGKSLQSVGENDIALIKYTKEGAVAWAVSIGSKEEDLGASLAFDSEENILITGQLGKKHHVDITKPDEFFVSIWPNPTNVMMNYESSLMNFRIVIIDINGRPVYDGYIKDKKGTLQLPNLSNGIYVANFYDMQTNTKVSKKLQIIKN